MQAVTSPVMELRILVRKILTYEFGDSLKHEFGQSFQPVWFNLYLTLAKFYFR